VVNQILIAPKHGPASDEALLYGKVGIGLETVLKSGRHVGPLGASALEVWPAPSWLAISSPGSMSEHFIKGQGSPSMSPKHYGNCYARMALPTSLPRRSHGEGYGRKGNEALSWL